MAEQKGESMGVKLKEGRRETGQIKDPISDKLAAKPIKSLTIEAINKNKDESSLFYNIFLYQKDQDKAVEIVRALQDKKPLSDELQQFRSEARKEYVAIRNDVEFVKQRITPEFISEVGEQSPEIAKLLETLTPETAADFFNAQRLFSMALEIPPKNYDNLKKSLGRIHKQLHSETRKHLRERIAEVTKELGLDEKKVNEMTIRENLDVEADLRKAVIEPQLKKIMQDEAHKKIREEYGWFEYQLMKPYERTKLWFQTFWPRRDLLRTIARDIALVERCNKELANVGKFLAASIDPESQKQIDQYSVDGSTEIKWPPNMIMWREDLDKAIKGTKEKGVRDKWRAKYAELANTVNSGRTGNDRLKKREIMATDEAKAVVKEFVDDLMKDDAKLLSGKGSMNKLLLGLRAEITDPDKQFTRANAEAWINK